MKTLIKCIFCGKIVDVKMTTNKEKKLVVKSEHRCLPIDKNLKV